MVQEMLSNQGSKQCSTLSACTVDEHHDACPFHLGYLKMGSLPPLTVT